MISIPDRVKQLVPIFCLLISLATAFYIGCLYVQISSMIRYISSLISYSTDLHQIGSQMHQLSSDLNQSGPRLRKLTSQFDKLTSQFDKMSPQMRKIAPQLHEFSSLSNIADLFQIKFYNSGVWATMRWLGVPLLQNPADNQEMQEVLFDIKPDVIIEAGTYAGGTALYYATIMDQFKPECKIFTIDIGPRIQDAPKYEVWKKHVIAITGSSTDPAIVDRVTKQIPKGAVVLVTLDSDHSKDHVYQELKIYSQLVTPGSYLVLQDTNINGHPVFKEFGPGPMEALNEFLAENHEFTSDLSREKYMDTFYPKGWLKRIK